MKRFDQETPVTTHFWDDVSDGDECISAPYTMTAARIEAFAELTGDVTPFHIDEEYARKSHFGQRVAHGLMGVSVADGLKTFASYRLEPGISMGWTWDFLKPIPVDTVVRARFVVTGKRPSKSRPGWGIVILLTELISDDGGVLQKGEHRLMVPRRPSAS